MSQAVKCDLFVYADDTCLVCKHKDINEIEKQLNKNFESICDWKNASMQVCIWTMTKLSLYFFRLNSK